jgi:genome maintenance exonuclease 1
MSTLNPPPFVEKIQYKACKQITDPLTRKRVYLTPDGEKTPSVTTILSATKDMTHLNAWKNRIGHVKAQQITTEAAGMGTKLHSNLEKFICGLDRTDGNNLIHIKANAMADQIIINGFSKIDEIWAIEQSLYFPGLYSGTTDLVAVYNGNLSICDYKQSNKLKKESYVDDYRMQLIAYILCHNEVYGTDIREGHVFLCTRGNDPIKVGGETYQQFDLLPKDFNYWQDQWLNKVEDYYTNYHKF